MISRTLNFIHSTHIRVKLSLYLIQRLSLSLPREISRKTRRGDSKSTPKEDIHLNHMCVMPHSSTPASVNVLTSSPRRLGHQSRSVLPLPDDFRFPLPGTFFGIYSFARQLEGLILLSLCTGNHSVDMAIYITASSKNKLILHSKHWVNAGRIIEPAAHSINPDAHFWSTRKDTKPKEKKKKERLDLSGN